MVLKHANRDDVRPSDPLRYYDASDFMSPIKMDPIKPATANHESPTKLLTSDSAQSTIRKVTLTVTLPVSPDIVVPPKKFWCCC